VYQRDYLVKQHCRQAPYTYLKAIRAALDYIDDGLLSSSVKQVSNINDIKDITPNWKRIEHYIAHTDDSKSAVFLAAFCCFFDNTIGGILLETLDCRTVRDIAASLDFNQLNIITTLMLNYL